MSIYSLPSVHMKMSLPPERIYLTLRETELIQIEYRIYLSIFKVFSFVFWFFFHKAWASKALFLRARSTGSWHECSQGTFTSSVESDILELNPWERFLVIRTLKEHSSDAYHAKDWQSFHSCIWKFQQHRRSSIQQQMIREGFQSSSAFNSYFREHCNVQEVFLNCCSFLLCEAAG